MKEESITDAQLREFLLGGLDDDTRQRIERLFLTDPQTKESVLISEQDLIEEYLDDGLSKEDKERFVSRYAQTAEQRHKLRITKSIRDWAVTEPKTLQVIPARVSVWSRVWTQLRFKPVLAVPIAVTLVLAIVLAIVWLNSQRERRKHFAIEQQLAQLNSPESLRENPPQMFSQKLKPVNVRGIEPEPEVKLRSEIRVVELSLPWIQKDRYPTYEAEVRRLDGEEVYTIGNLQADSNDLVRVRLSTELLRPGHYQVHLTGIANNGARSSDEEYSFIVQ